MSKRRNSTPSTLASCLASSVFPTPVGPLKRKLPMGFSGDLSPERASLMAAVSSWMAASCPKMTERSAGSRLAMESRSEAETLFSGILAIFATTASTSWRVTLPRPLLECTEAVGGAGLVDDVDGLVGEEALVDVLGRELHGGHGCAASS